MSKVPFPTWYVVIHIPSSFTPPSLLVVAVLSGCMRLDYYSGADTFIINTTGASYEIVPVIDTLTCLQVCVVCVVCGVCGVCNVCC